MAEEDTRLSRFVFDEPVLRNDVERRGSTTGLINPASCLVGCRRTSCTEGLIPLPDVALIGSVAS